MDQKLREKIKHEQLGNGLKDHNGLSWLCCYQITQGKTEPVVSAEEKQILRQLARKVAQLAEQPVQEERRKLWTEHHGLKVTDLHRPGVCLV